MRGLRTPVRIAPTKLMESIILSRGVVYLRIRFVSVCSVIRRVAIELAVKGLLLLLAEVHVRERQWVCL